MADDGRRRSGRARSRTSWAATSSRRRARATRRCVRSGGFLKPQPLVLYTGTFEPYQGLDLLLDATARLHRRVARASQVLVVGGTPEQVDRERGAGHGGRCARSCSPGSVRRSEIPHFVEACDILVSPRIAGTNTPLKIYSYLRSRAAHRRDQPADAHPGARRHVRVLVEPTPDALADGLRHLVAHARRGGSARRGRRGAPGADALQPRDVPVAHTRRLRQADGGLARAADRARGRAGPASPALGAVEPSVRSPKLP